MTPLVCALWLDVFHWPFGMDWETHLFAWTLPAFNFFCRIGFEKPAKADVLNLINLRRPLSRNKFCLTCFSETWHQWPTQTEHGPGTTQTRFVGPLYYEAVAAKRTITTNRAPDCFTSQLQKSSQFRIQTPLFLTCPLVAKANKITRLP